jgi:hypothetical protein
MGRFLDAAAPYLLGCAPVPLAVIMGQPLLGVGVVPSWESHGNIFGAL